MLTPVVQAFVVGAARDVGADEALVLDGQAYRLAGASPAERLLARASAAALCSLALAPPMRPALGFAAPVAEALARDLPEIGARTRHLLQRLLATEDHAALEEALQVIGAHGRRVAPGLLPALFDALDAPQRRAWLSPVLCSGARWLAGENPDWQWALDDAAEPAIAFESATGVARVKALTRLREIDPAQAREQLAQSFAKDGADERARLVECLATGLSPADEAFLESALDDRAKSVRAAAAALLARLPDSALVARAVARGLPLLAMERGLLRKSLKVTLPDAANKAEERDGIDPKSAPPGLHGAGPRQVQLAQMIAQVPVSRWTQHLGLDLPALIAQFGGNEFSGALLAGLAMAASRRPEPDVLRALAVLADKHETRATYQHWIEPALPGLPDFDRFVAERIRASHTLDMSLLAALPAPWPRDVSDAVLAWARHRDRGAELAKDYTHYEYVGLLKLAATRVAPDAAFLAGWTTLDRGNASSSQQRAAEAIDAFLSTVQHRIDFISSLEMP